MKNLILAWGLLLFLVLAIIQGIEGALITISFLVIMVGAAMFFAGFDDKDQDNGTSNNMIGLVVAAIGIIMLLFISNLNL